MTKTSRKLIPLLGLSALLATGCSPYSRFGDTTAYSVDERGRAIGRAWDVDGKQLMDDVDSALLLTPPSGMTPWHTR
jgi:hypothetical protein